ncbi:hypothetical protein FBY35_1097 [Streptomyces sp. SLBN-118]|nr:hypothetical protein [Streptomyces sp. SLBN-118]TQK50749.1 hypothetical protein FBY35_1097 [Streptomyces sp. SLBN-118]
MRWLDQALALETTPSPARAKALIVDGLLALLRGQTQAAAALAA